MTSPADADAAVPVPPRRKRAVRVVQVLASLSVAVVLFGYAIPKLAGGYDAVWEQLRTLSLGQLVLLLLVWLLGLWVYAFALQRCLDGLRHLQGMVINAAGSAISNLVPFGGAAGVATTYGMAMSWGHAASAVSATILATGLFNFFATLLLPVLALVLLATEGRATWQLAVPAIIGLVVIAATAALLALIERSERTAERIGDVAQRVGERLAHRLHLHREPQWKDALLSFRHQTSRIVGTQWKALTATLVGYKLCQYLLLLLCVHAVDPTTTLGWIDVFAAFAFGRVLATVPVTPAGVGVVEAGSIAALVALGGNEASAAAAVLLFSGFVYAMEIPLGGLAWVLWATKRSWRRDRLGSPEAPIASGGREAG